MQLKTLLNLTNCAVKTPPNLELSLCIQAILQLLLQELIQVYGSPTFELAMFSVAHISFGGPEEFQKSRL